MSLEFCQYFRPAAMRYTVYRRRPGLAGRAKPGLSPPAGIGVAVPDPGADPAAPAPAAGAHSSSMYFSVISSGSDVSICNVRTVIGVSRLAITASEKRKGCRSHLVNDLDPRLSLRFVHEQQSTRRGHHAGANWARGRARVDEDCQGRRMDARISAAGQQLWLNLSRDYDAPMPDACW